MSRGEALRLQIRLAGLTKTDVGRMLGVGRDRVSEFLDDREDFHEFSEYRRQLRGALAEGPDLRAIYAALVAGYLLPGTAGRDVRWTRHILWIPLVEWCEEFGFSTWWWSVCERDEDRMAIALAEDYLDRRTLWAIEVRMVEAAVVLGRFFPDLAGSNEGDDDESTTNERGEARARSRDVRCGRDRWGRG